MMEVVLALGLFAMAATGFAVALARTADAANLAQKRMQIIRILKSSLTEAISIPALEEGVTSVTLEEEVAGTSVEIDTKVTRIEDLHNQDGEELSQMYRIEVSAHWFESGEWMEETAETWRYAPLYQR